MIKQITTYLNLKNKYGFKEGTYLFGMRYCNRKKYYDLIIKKITREFHDEIVIIIRLTGAVNVKYGYCGFKGIVICLN